MTLSPSSESMLAQQQAQRHQEARQQLALGKMYLHIARAGQLQDRSLLTLAANCFFESTRKNRRDAQPLAHLAWLWFAFGNPHQAMDYLKDALQLEPENGAYRKLEALILAKLQGKNLTVLEAEDELDIVAFDTDDGLDERYEALECLIQNSLRAAHGWLRKSGDAGYAETYQRLQQEQTYIAQELTALALHCDVVPLQRQQRLLEKVWHQLLPPEIN